MSEQKDKITVDVIILIIALLELIMYVSGIVVPKYDEPIPIYQLVVYLIFCIFLFVLRPEKPWQRFNIIRAINFTLLVLLMRAMPYFQSFLGLKATNLVIALNLVLTVFQVIAISYFIKYYKTRYRRGR